MTVVKLGQAPGESVEPVISGLAIGVGGDVVVLVRVRRCLCLPYLFHPCLPYGDGLGWCGDRGVGGVDGRRRG